MDEASGLQGLLARACGRSGSEGAGTDARTRDAAFEELLRLVMIYIRAGMGRRLRDHRESADVCQSVAKSFVEDFQSGKVSFENEALLAGYLKLVVKNKLADLARRDAAAKRGGAGESRESRLDADGLKSEGGPPPPAAHSAGVGAAAAGGASSDMRRDEAYQRVMAGLSEEEQSIVRLRRQGLSWDQIAGMLGKDAAAVRQQFSRVQRRVGGKELGGGGGAGVESEG